MFLAAHFYERQAAGLGEAFLNAVGQAMERAITAPNSGVPVQEGIRKQLVRRFPFSVFYQIEDDGIFVLAVMHQARHPDYWRDRV